MLFKTGKATTSKKIKIGEVLLKKNLISEEQLAQALLEQSQSGGKLGDILIFQGIITSRQLEKALSTQYWQNLTATFFVSVGAFSSTLPQVAVAQFSSIPRPVQSLSKSQLDREFTNSNNNYLANRSATLNDEISSIENISLAANPRPTESNPLHGFLFPFASNRPLSQAYNGTTHRGRMHYARDIPAAIGTPIFAMRSGTVVGVEDRFPDTGGGPENISKFNYVWIEHDGGYRSAYLHLKQGFTSSIRIKVGDRVKAGQLIGFSGNSGWSSGPHLHVEVHREENRNFGQTVPFNLTMRSGSSIARQ